VHSYPTHASLDPPESITQTASRSVQPFLHSSRHAVPILYNGPPYLPKMPICIPSNTSFLGFIRVHNPNGISIASAVFAGLTIVTDRQTDRQTDHATPSVTIDHIYVVLRCGLITTTAVTTTNVDRANRKRSRIFNLLNGEMAQH